MRDNALLLDIVNAAKDARSFVEELDWAGFQSSRLHQNAVIRSLEIIGGAAGKLSIDFRSRHQAIGWHDMINTRHRLIHAYADVRLDIVWAIVTTKLLLVNETLQPLTPQPSDR